jgi:hypothetical protein
MSWRPRYAVPDLIAKTWSCYASRASKGEEMGQESEHVELSPILGHDEQEMTLADIGGRISAAREELRQLVASAESSNDDAPPMSNREVIAQLADAVFIGDDLVFFEIIKDHPQAIRWSNPTASNGAYQLAALREVLLVQARIRENTLPNGSRVVLVLSDSPVIDCEALHSMVVGADELLIVASRTTLRSILRTSKNRLC